MDIVLKRTVVQECNRKICNRIVLKGCFFKKIYSNGIRTQYFIYRLMSNSLLLEKKYYNSEIHNTIYENFHES